MEIKDLASLPVALLFLCPGIVFVTMAALFTTGRPPGVSKDTVGGLIALSIVYAVIAAALGLLPSVLTNGMPIVTLKWPRRVGLFLYAVGVPFASGVAWGALVRAEVPYRLARRLKLNPLHPKPSAWETAFSRLKGGEFILVTMKDGSTVKGYFERRSCISNDPDFRDIYIEEMLPPPGQASDVVRGIWISPGEIKHIEVVSRRETKEHEAAPAVGSAAQGEVGT